MRDESSIQFDEDVRLMLKVKGGDQLAYTRLYEKYVPVVKRYLARREGQFQSREDMAQEVFTRIWRRRGQYQPLAPVTHYLLSVAANVLHESRAKSHGPGSTGLCAPQALVDESEPSPPSRAQFAEQLQAMRALMASLPVRQRQAVELVYLAGLGPDEAADRLGCSVRTVRVHLCLARRRLRNLARLSE
jgi:RNA polymerase sigma-70 factor (ECF subfamily)